MRHRWASAAGAALCLLLAGCADSSEPDDFAPFVTCENGIVVYAGVDCDRVQFDSAVADPELQDQIDTLRAEAEADPSRQLANGQAVMRLLAAAPFSVCEALQTDPTSEFLSTPNIAPVAAELEPTICPSLTQLNDS